VNKHQFEEQNFFLTTSGMMKYDQSREISIPRTILSKLKEK
jgi:hypothetical protein